MSSASALECDRCGATALCGRSEHSGDVVPPEGWGIVRLARGSSFLNTGALDLCPACFNDAYHFVRSKVKP